VLRFRRRRRRRRRRRSVMLHQAYLH